MKRLFLVSLMLFIIGCPRSQYISDRGFMSSLEAFVPEAEIRIDNYPCRDIKNRFGSCSVAKEEGSDLKVSFILLSDAEITWKSNCEFTVDELRTDHGSLITTGMFATLLLEDIPEAGQVCSIGFVIIDTDREAGEIVPEAQGQMALVSLIIGSEDYVYMPTANVRIKGGKIKIKASKFTKHMMISHHKRHQMVEKLHEIEFSKPKTGAPIIVRTQSDIGRYSRKVLKLR